LNKGKGQRKRFTRRGANLLTIHEKQVRNIDCITLFWSSHLVGQHIHTHTYTLQLKRKAVIYLVVCESHWLFSSSNNEHKHKIREHQVYSKIDQNNLKIQTRSVTRGHLVVPEQTIRLVNRSHFLSYTFLIMFGSICIRKLINFNKNWNVAIANVTSVFLRKGALQHYVSVNVSFPRL